MILFKVLGVLYFSFRDIVVLFSTLCPNNCFSSCPLSGYLGCTQYRSCKDYTPTLEKHILAVTYTLIQLQADPASDLLLL